MFYPAYIHTDRDGRASGFFPDVPGCFFAGGDQYAAILWQSRAHQYHAPPPFISENRRVY
jgi:hypothetical protein